MAHFVLLGATGYVGRHVLQALEQAPGVARLTCLGRRAAAETGADWVPADLGADEPAVLAARLGRLQPDAIINCAGRTEGGVRELVAANVDVVATLLEAVMRGAPRARLVHLSSAAEYGAVMPGEAVREDTPPQPVSFYGVTKLAATQLLCQARAAGLVDAVVLRVFNLVGPSLSVSTVLGKAAADLRWALQAGAPSVQLGSLAAYRDFVDVRDVARAVVMAAMATAPKATVFNIGQGKAIGVRAAVQHLAKVAGFAGVIEETSQGSPRSSAVAWQQANVERAAQQLGWTPALDLSASLASLWHSYV